MTEELFQYIWKASLYSTANIQIESGESLKVINPGFQNTNAGPDFSNAQLLIDNTLWVGNVEVHLKASDWYLHHHDTNSNYDSVILHVVLKNDKPVYYPSEQAIPVFIPKINPQVSENYYSLLQSTHQVCGNVIKNCDPTQISLWLSRMGTERLEQKSKDIFLILENNVYNWEETFYNLLFQSFGFSVNATPFRMLSNILHPKIWKKHTGNLKEMEALLFGSAGFLEEAEDNYQTELMKIYAYFKVKYRLKSMSKDIWHFLRLRPNNFPTIRLAQLANLLCSTLNFAEQIEKGFYGKDFFQNLTVSTSEYWKEHHMFGRKSKSPSSKMMGINSTQSIIINVIIPFLFAYGKYKGNTDFQEKAIEIAEQLPSERNKILNNWKDIGLRAYNSFESQGLIYLRQEYCRKKRCLDCVFGQKKLQYIDY